MEKNGKKFGNKKFRTSILENFGKKKKFSTFTCDFEIPYLQNFKKKFNIVKIFSKTILKNHRIHKTIKNKKFPIFNWIISFYPFCY